MQQAEQKWVQTGIASWYGKDFHGRLTSSGEVYNMYGLSAAHKTLPLGTKVKVTNLSSGRKVVVCINDRGPFVNNRIIDMSYGAAKCLGMVEDGLAKVRIEVIKAPHGISSIYTLQFGAFRDKSNAVNMSTLLKTKGYNPSIEKTLAQGDSFYRVRLGKFTSLERATKTAEGFDAAGLACIVVGL